jgi:carboxyl-terminal processing protease
MPPAHKRLIVALSALLPILLVGGLWLGGHPQDLPAFVRDAFVANHDTRVVDEAIARISSDYYRPIARGKLSDASIGGAVASLDDRFSHYLTPKEFRAFNAPPSFTGIGVEVAPSLVKVAPGRRGLLIVRAFDSSPAARASLRPGEVIVAVNGRPLTGLSVEASRALIVGPPGTDVTLTLEHAPARGRSAGARHTHSGAHVTGGRHTQASPRRTLRITRATISEPVVASATRAVRGLELGVVALATFSPGAHGEVRTAVERELHSRGARGIVLDLRANGGGLVEEARLVASIFIARGTIVSTRGRSQSSQTLTAAGDAIPATIPLVALVDANTASAAEIVTAALQDHRRATVVGTHTFGKGVFQEEEPLSNGGALDITVGEYFTPAGRNLGGGGIKQGAGVSPEVEVAHGVDSQQGLTVALRTLAAKVK